ncbi:MAG: VOC family protein [Vicinamibacteria bacterium]
MVPGDDGRILHAQLTFGNGGIMLGSAEGFSQPNLCKSPREVGGVGTFEISVYVADPDAHYKHAVAQGAEIVVPIEDKPYGGRGYSCKDPEGHVWGFSSYDPWAE